jgi:5-methylcytosine-specific restriction enzyme A
MTRPGARARGYSHRWDKYRARYLAQHPHCVFCEQAGRITRATVVDHIQPHKGDHRLFWNPANHQPLCATCHDGTKRVQEQTGRLRGCDEDGNPLDQQHHWRRE